MDNISDNVFLRSELLTSEELLDLERQYPDGITSGEIISVFEGRGMRLSEATFRKYVQQGLLPRSRRVGPKGKHKGSRGIYPIGILRQINEIKRMMGLNYTIEDIRFQLAFVAGELEEAKNLLESVFVKLEENLANAHANSADVGQVLQKNLDEARASTDFLFETLEGVAMQIRDQAQMARSAM